MGTVMNLKRNCCIRVLIKHLCYSLLVIFCISTNICLFCEEAKITSIKIYDDETEALKDLVRLASLYINDRNSYNNSSAKMPTGNKLYFYDSKDKAQKLLSGINKEIISGSQQYITYQNIHADLGENVYEGLKAKLTDAIKDIYSNNNNVTKILDVLFLYGEGGKDAICKKAIEEQYNNIITYTCQEEPYLDSKQQASQNAQQSKTQQQTQCANNNINQTRWCTHTEI